MRRLFLTMLLCACTLVMWAVPAKRITLNVMQPDGTMLAVTQMGDEFFSYFVTDDMVAVLRKENAYFYAHLEDGAIAPSKHLAHNVAERTLDEQQVVAQLPRMEEMTAAISQRVSAMRSSRAYRETEVPTMGEIHVPVILVEYADVKLSLNDANTRFDKQFNGDDYKDAGGYGSVKEYFEDQSDGQFIPRFDIIGPVTLSKKRDYYGENNGDIIDPNAQAMITEACRLADESADFSKYDNNGDGYVDFLYVIYAGYGESANSSTLANTVWPHKFQIDPLALDGVKVSLYACSNELDGDKGTNMDGIGSVCHEFSHCLGLPDFYATNYASGAFGMDNWSVLHSGNYNNGSHTPCGYTGYEKDFLGWKKLIVLDEPTDIVLKPMSEGGDAYKIVNDANPNEYYIIENHKKSKWDSHIAAEGMLVIHVDYSESAWQNNTVNNDPSHQRMTIIPADNKLTGSSLSGDVYPGSAKNTELTSTSTPAATVYVGEYMGKDLTNISKNGDDVSLSFMKGALLVPKLDEASDITGSGFSISWNQVSGVKEYEVQLDVLEENPYMLDEDFNKVTKTNSDIGGVMDKYTNRLGWAGEGVYGLDGAIRIGQANKEGYLFSPTIACDSTHYTIFFSVRKNEAATNDVYMILAVGDQAWGNSLVGYGLTIDNDEWAAYYVVLDTIGDNTFLYIDTRDNEQTTGKESMCVELDDIYILPGDYRKQDPNYGAPTRRTQYALCKEKAMPYQAQAIAVPATRQAMMREGENSADRRYYANTVYTERTADLNFRFDNLDGALYRASVRSVRDSVYSRYSNTVDVEIVDSMLPQLELTIDAEMNNDSLYLTVEDADATIYYTLDGTIPTAYSNQYTGPLALKEKSTLNLMARKEGYRRTDYFAYSNWFEHEGFTYRIQSTLSPKVALTEAMGGNDGSSYVGHIVIDNEVYIDSLVYAVTGIDDDAFRNATALRSITLSGNTIERVGSKLFHGCSELIAVMWDITHPITSELFDASSYHNLLVYAPSGTAFSHPLIDEGRMALVVDGQAGTLHLNARKPFYCPRPFVAEEVSYQRTFTQTTGKGESAGWETIALPFDVEKFEHAGKGEIAPFGTTATHNFWLAELTDKGFQQATTLRANTAYVIAMPNHNEYGNNTLNGSVTFSASQATIHATDEVNVSEGPELTLTPTYEPVAASDDVYALNIGAAYGNNKPGSIFMPGRYATNAFSAYGLPAAGTQAAPYYRIQTQPDVEENVASEFAVESREGVIYIMVPEAQTVVVYDMAGRQVCRVACDTGVNTITHLQPGIYMVEKTKVYVER
ncbi:MAG: M6 family metalloprotease domain-containing protein [Bacteroidaceae bacterium]|nr:M6 family metalloprotease domain-containing protein [Bacteroidaceae bacterium]